MRMVMISSIGVGKVLCCAVAAALVSSCTDPPEMLEYQKDTELLKEVVRDTRQDVQQASEELHSLQKEKRTWDKDEELDVLQAEVDELKDVRNVAKAELSQVVEEFEIMKKTRLP